MTPAVSVLIPAYRADAYVDVAIRSVLAQTFSDWEIVAVDDASPDRTAEILQSWSQKDPRIRFFRNEANLGMTGNWNRCLAEARGTFALKLDADDALKPRTLEVLVAAMHEENVIGAGVRTLACDEHLEPFDGLPGDDVILRGGIDPYRDVTLDNEKWFAIAAHGHQLWHSCAVMLPRELLVRIGGYDVRFGCATDTELIWRVLSQPGRFAHRAYAGVLYRTVGGSISDVFRSQGWAMWEGIAGNLLTLHRWRAQRPLSRALRLRYASLWELWRSNAEANRAKWPPAIWEKLSSVVGEVAAPPIGDRLLLRVRNLIRSSM